MSLERNTGPAQVVVLRAQQGRSEREGLSVQGTGCGKMVPDKWDVLNRLFLSEIATANTRPVLKITTC